MRDVGTYFIHTKILYYQVEFYCVSKLFVGNDIICIYKRHPLLIDWSINTQLKPRIKMCNLDIYVWQQVKMSLCGPWSAHIALEKWAFHYYVNSSCKKICLYIYAELIWDGSDVQCNRISRSINKLMTFNFMRFHTGTFFFLRHVIAHIYVVMKISLYLYDYLKDILKPFKGSTMASTLANIGYRANTYPSLPWKVKLYALNTVVIYICSVSDFKSLHMCRAIQDIRYRFSLGLSLGLTKTLTVGGNDWLILIRILFRTSFWPKFLYLVYWNTYFL